MEIYGVVWLFLSWVVYKMMWGNDVDIILPLFIISAVVTLAGMYVFALVWGLIIKIWKSL